MSDQLSEILSALGDPTRRAIVERLTRGSATPGELAVGTTITAQAISRHLNVLEEAGLIRRSREGQRRPCHIVPGSLRTASLWIEQYRPIWEGSFDRLAQHLAEKQGDEPDVDDNH